MNSFKPLVIGAPRTGFTLLCSIMVHFSQQSLNKSKYNLKSKLFKVLNYELGNNISSAIVERFNQEGIDHSLIYNPAFRFITGGPKWLDESPLQDAVIRKYIGVKGMGDFTLNIKHPKEVLDNDMVVHSHSHPSKWLDIDYYKDYQKFACIRNPAGTLNSSIFSINALTSEYIQHHIPPEKDNDEIRQELALYKFTDLDFFSGLVTFLKSYLVEFADIRDKYQLMRWEDLINQPTQTICNLAHAANIDLSEQQASHIWKQLDHLNLSGPHKHNYRQGKGIVDDWKNSMTNHHLAIMREQGLEEFSQFFGYAPLKDLNENNYNTYQKQIDTLIKSGRIYDEIEDKDLFTFAFNKSNLNSEKYNFKRYDWKENSQIERSCFLNEDLQSEIWAVAEHEAAMINHILREFLSLSIENKRDADIAIKHIMKLCSKLYNEDNENVIRAIKEMQIQLN